jgi:BirA family biotin operon repressor/biotin-[acetyl-CoA-carboxylase] ligase
LSLKLSQSELEAVFSSQSLGSWEIEFYEQLESTMIAARERIPTTRPVCVLAQSQGGGRGQHGRAWVSEPGGLYATYLIPVPLECTGTLQGFSLLVGIACAEVLESSGGQVMLKWPNDIYTREGKKLGGILCECHEQSGTRWLAIGIGINVDNALTLPTQASIRSIGVTRASVSVLASAIAAQLEQMMKRYVDRSMAGIAEDWERRDFLLGRSVVIEALNAKYLGQVRGIQEEGALLLESAEGLMSVWSGHVIVPDERL